MTNTEVALTAETPVLREFANGTRDYAITDEIHVGVRADGYVYWASPEGWAWVVATARVESVRILGDSTGWPSMWDDSYYLVRP